MDAPFLKFPAGFKWGVATSAHQIEGGNDRSDAWAWEEAGRAREGQRSGLAADHWNRMESDIGLLQELGVGLYRMSVEWARVEPEAGRFDESAIEHYATEVALLRRAGIEPQITLSHFTFPKWIADRGGWEWADLPEAFARFASRMYEALGAEVASWYTINEPMVILLGGYKSGDFPPGETRALSGIRKPLLGIVRSHAAMYAALHSAAARAGRPVRVGIAQHLRYFEPESWLSPLDHFAARAIAQAWNWCILDAIETGWLRLSFRGHLDITEEIPELRGSQDFIGVNYYSGDRVSLSIPGLEPKLTTSPTLEKNDLNWDIRPEGLYDVLKAAAKRYPNQPLIVAENGIADVSDAKRARFIQEHLKFLHRAIKEGIAVEGYCHWSLLDNWEWREGFQARFGLYAVDFATQARTLRASGHYYRDVIRGHGVVEVAGTSGRQAGGSRRRA